MGYEYRLLWSKVVRLHDGRELATLRSALGAAQATVASLQATAGRDTEQATEGAWTDQMESRFHARLEAAVAEETSELRGQLADAAAKLEAAERKVLLALPLSMVLTKLWPQIR